MSSCPIDHIGTIENSAFMGFSHMDLYREILDNQFDAKASIIQNYLLHEVEKNRSLMIFGDNALGMNIEQLQTCATINKRKEASDDKNGLFGYGGFAAYYGFTQGEGKAIILSKKDGEPLVNQLTLDFPKFKRDNQIVYIAHDATASMTEMWNTYAVNKNHGTLIILECHHVLIQDMIEKLHQENLGQTYADYLNKGIKVTIFTNNQKILIELHATNVIENARSTKNTVITVWKKEQDIIAEYKDGNGAKKYFDLEDRKPKSTINLSANGYKEIGKINYTNSFRYYEHDKANNWLVCDGGYYFKRGKKVINSFETQLNAKPGGDFGHQNIKESSKHLVEFTSNLDSLFGIQVNKSKIDKNLINLAIFKTLEYLAKDFCTKSWNKIKEEASTPVKQQVVAKQQTQEEIVTMRIGDKLEQHQVDMAILATKQLLKSSTPKQEVVSTPKQEVISTPKQQVVSPPKQQVVSPPKQQVVSTPKQEVVSTPKQQVVSTPKQQVVSTPKQQVVSTSKQEVVSTPKQEIISTQLPIVLQLNVTVEELKELFNEHISKKYKDKDHVSDTDQAYYNSLWSALHKS